MKKSLSLLAAISTLIVASPISFAADASSSSASSVMSSTSSSAVSSATSSSSSVSTSSTASTMMKGPCDDKMGVEKVICQNQVSRSMNMPTMRSHVMNQQGKTVAACKDKTGADKVTCLQNLGKVANKMMKGTASSMMSNHMDTIKNKMDMMKGSMSSAMSSAMSSMMSDGSRSSAMAQKMNAMMKSTIPAACAGKRSKELATCFQAGEKRMMHTMMKNASSSMSSSSASN